MNEYKKDRPTSEQLVDLLDNELEITIYADVVHGLDYEYKQLQEENKKLNGAIQTYDTLLKSNIEENKQIQERMEYLERSNNRREDIIIEQRQEIIDLEDNWNKLKEYCKENTLCYEVGDDENTKLIGSKIHGLNVLDKMQELEQGSDK